MSPEENMLKKEGKMIANASWVHKTFRYKLTENKFSPKRELKYKLDSKQIGDHVQIVNKQN